MGFLNIFRKPQKQHSLGEAMALIQSELDGMQRRNKEEAYKASLKIVPELASLRGLIDEFGKVEVERAKSSAAVKDRFCSRAKSQLAAAGKPDYGDPFLFLQEARSLLGGLGGLTPRQMLHINFFFREDFRPVAKKMKEISAMLDIASGGGDHQRAVSLHERMKELENKKTHLGKMLAAEEEKLKHAVARELPQLPKQPVSADLDDAESRLRALRQEVDSFLSIQKALKKFAYISESREPILQAYMDSPSAALVQDAEFRILDFAAGALRLVNEGKIEPDRKLDNVVSSVDYLKRKRDALISARRAVDEEAKKFRIAREHFEMSLKARTNRIAEIESETKEAEKSVRELKEELSETERESAKTRAELCMLASRILDAAIV